VVVLRGFGAKRLPLNARCINSKIMKAFLKSIAAHPFSAICYVLYLTLFVSQVIRELKYQRIVAQNNGKWPYGVREWAGIPVYLFGIIFLVVTIFWGTTKPENGNFYWWLSLAILLPMIIYWNI
jgi:hypothetical protein